MEDVRESTRSNWSLYHRLAWEEQFQNSAISSLQRHFLLFCDYKGYSDSIEKSIIENGGKCYRAYSGDYCSIESNKAVLRPSEPEDFVKLFQEISSTKETWDIVFLWGLDISETTNQINSDNVKEFATLTCGSLLHLLQAVSRLNMSIKFPRFWLVTKATLDVLPDVPVSSYSVFQSTVIRRCDEMLTSI
jgi:hypothetical protein